MLSFNAIPHYKLREVIRMLEDLEHSLDYFNIKDEEMTLALDLVCNSVDQTFAGVRQDLKARLRDMATKRLPPFDKYCLAEDCPHEECQKAIYNQ